jgi:amino-acid N-acetyltransferase
MMQEHARPRSDLVFREALHDDLERVRALLRSSDLPLDGTESTRLTIAEHAGELVGCAGLEVHGEAGLLRSVAVEPTWRGRGVGEALVQLVLRSADDGGLESVFLLTMTAAAWFPRFGFTVVTREDVPAALRESVEFASACPDTAAVMRRIVRATRPREHELAL